MSEWSSADKELLRLPLYLIIGVAGGFLIANGQDVGFSFWHYVGLSACLCVAIILILFNTEDWTW